MEAGVSLASHRYGCPVSGMHLDGSSPRRELVPLVERRPRSVRGSDWFPRCTSITRSYGPQRGAVRKHRTEPDSGPGSGQGDAVLIVSSVLHRFTFSRGMRAGKVPVGRACNGRGKWVIKLSTETSRNRYSRRDPWIGSTQEAGHSRLKSNQACALRAFCTESDANRFPTGNPEFSSEFFPREKARHRLI